MIHLSIGQEASSSTNLPDICHGLYDRTLLIKQPMTNAWHGLYDRTLLIKQPMTNAWQIYSAACAN
jgi:hypothetical protein